MSPRRHDLPLGVGIGAALRAALGVLLCLGWVSAVAEPLLTGVSYVDGTATYSLFDAKSPGGPGNFSSSLHAGMAIPDSTWVDVAKDGKAMLTPIPAIRYLLQPGTQVVNESFGFRSTDVGGQTFDHRLRLQEGTMVGDVAGPLAAFDDRVETPRGSASSSNGHFLIRSHPDGSTKYAVLSGLLTVNVPGQRSYQVGPGQVLTLLSDSAKLDALSQDTTESGLTPEQRILAQVKGSAVAMGSLADEPELAALLAEPMPLPNLGLFASIPELADFLLLPGQVAPGTNPKNLVQHLPDFIPNLPNPDNSGGNPPVSPILP